MLARGGWDCYSVGAGERVRDEGGKLWEGEAREPREKRSVAFSVRSAGVGYLLVRL